MPSIERPRIAVVIPCYNDGRTLPAAVQSALHQEPLELVVVNDGSTDPVTLSVLSDLVRQGIRVVNQENRGLSEARMCGVAATSAQYIFPLDADDRLAPHCLSPLADALDRNPHAAVAWGDLHTFGDAELVERKADELDAWLITHINVVPGTSLIRRDALLAVGGWRLRHGYEDWDLWMSLVERGWKGVHLPIKMLLYRRHGARMLARSNEQHEKIYADLRRRHRRLFSARKRAWLRSRAPLRVKLLLPLIAQVPGMKGTTKVRLGQMVFGQRTLAVLRRRLFLFQRDQWKARGYRSEVPSVAAAEMTASGGEASPRRRRFP